MSGSPQALAVHSSGDPNSMIGEHSLVVHSYRTPLTRHGFAPLGHWRTGWPQSSLPTACLRAAQSTPESEGACEQQRIPRWVCPDESVFYPMDKGHIFWRTLSTR